MAHVKLQIRSAGEERYRLERAILIYESNFHASGVPNGHEPYATLHNIVRGKGGPQLAPGVPATAEACAAFAQAMQDHAAFAGFISPNILYVGPRLTAWWRAPAPARVWFKVEEAREEKTPASQRIGERSAITPQPGLIFACADSEWHVFAVKGADRPGPATQIWRAPYFNVWELGHICEGNIERPKRVSSDTIDRFERAFFDSRFTHPNAHKGLVNFKGGSHAFWRAMLDQRWKHFPERCLVREGAHTLESLVKTLQETRHRAR